MTPEGEVKREIKKWLEKKGSEVYTFWPVQTGMGRRTVDLLACYRGKFIAIEVKKLGGRPTALQDKVLDQIVAAGGIAFWVDSFEEFHDLWHLTVGH